MSTESSSHGERESGRVQAQGRRIDDNSHDGPGHRAVDVKWGLSPLDWCSHAIDERGDYPLGVFKAECGHLLMMVTTLHDRPYGRACKVCAAQQLARAAIACQGQ